MQNCGHKVRKKANISKKIIRVFSDACVIIMCNAEDNINLNLTLDSENKYIFAAL